VTNRCPICRQEFLSIAVRESVFSAQTLGTVQVQPKQQQQQYADDDLDDMDNFLVNDLAEVDCYVCQRSEDEHLMLICDFCNIKCCHTYCDSEIEDGFLIPEEEWYCHFCQGREQHEFSL